MTVDQGLAALLVLAWLVVVASTLVHRGGAKRSLAWLALLWVAIFAGIYALVSLLQPYFT